MAFPPTPEASAKTNPPATLSNVKSFLIYSSSFPPAHRAPQKPSTRVEVPVRFYSGQEAQPRNVIPDNLYQRFLQCPALHKGRPPVADGRSSGLKAAAAARKGRRRGEEQEAACVTRKRILLSQDKVFPFPFMKVCSRPAVYKKSG